MKRLDSYQKKILSQIKIKYKFQYIGENNLNENKIEKEKKEDIKETKEKDTARVKRMRLHYLKMKTKQIAPVYK